MISKFLVGQANTVDSIMSTFNKTINELKSLAVLKNEEVVGISQKITTLEEQRVAAGKEAVRAAQVSEKLSQLLG